MTTNIICNAFSLQMIPEEILRNPSMISIEPVTADAIPTDVVSAVGHADTASVLSVMLGRKIEYNRITVSLSRDTVLYVAQVVGGRLPEGATTLPEGIEIRFYRVSIPIEIPAALDPHGTCYYPR